MIEKIDTIPSPCLSKITCVALNYYRDHKYRRCENCGKCDYRQCLYYNEHFLSIGKEDKNWYCADWQPINKSEVTK